MKHVAVEISGDGAGGTALVAGGGTASVPRAGIRIHGDPHDSRVLPRTSIKEDFEDNSFNVEITSGGEAGWARAKDQAHSGSWSLKSGAITATQSTVATVTVPAGATSVSFWYRVSSGPADKFWAVAQPANLIHLEASGEVGWTYATLNVTGWTHIQFWYVKDGATSGGSDAAWIDDLTFHGTFPGVPSVVVHNDRTYGPVKAEMGELSDGDYGIAVVNPAGELTKLHDVIFGPTTGIGPGGRLPNSWGDPSAGTGPTVSVTLGETGRALVILSVEFSYMTAGYLSPPDAGGYMSFEVTGATTRAPNAVEAVASYASAQMDGGPNNPMVQIGDRKSYVTFIEGLNPGLNHFTAKYRAVTTRTVDAFNPTMVVLPY